MEEQEEKTPLNSPQQPQKGQEQKKIEAAPKVEKGVWISLWDDIGKIKDIYERAIFIVGALVFLGGVIWSLFLWYNHKKVPDTVTDSINKITECVQDDTEISGYVYWNKEIKKGAKIKLNVFNTHTNKFEESRINELKEKDDGSFRFHYCKATTSKVEFEVWIGDSSEPIYRLYEVGEIPKDVLLN